MEQTIWKPISGFEGLYKINRTGNILSLHKRHFKREVSQRIDRAGYLTVRLSKNGKVSTQYIHRLLGLTYIPEIEGKLFINHINGNKLDNKIENLEWVTHSENMVHAHKNDFVKIKTKPVIDICSGKTYLSIKEAAKAININYGTCRNYLNGNIKYNKTCLRLAS